MSGHLAYKLIISFLTAGKDFPLEYGLSDPIQHSLSLFTVNRKRYFSKITLFTKVEIGFL